MSAAFEHIVMHVQNDVAHIILSRPDKLNAIADQTREEIGAALTAASEDAGIGCVLIRAKAAHSVLVAILEARAQPPLP